MPNSVHSIQSSAFAAPASSDPIRKLIRSKTKDGFLTEKGTWTRDIRKARVFEDYLAALAVSSQFAPYTVEIYYSFDEDEPSEWDFAL